MEILDKLNYISSQRQKDLNLNHKGNYRVYTGYI